MKKLYVVRFTGPALTGRLHAGPPNKYRAIPATAEEAQTAMPYREAQATARKLNGEPPSDWAPYWDTMKTYI